MLKTEYLKLEDLVDQNPPLDPGIRSLVKAMRILGYRTIGSCEGHIDDVHHPFPWVTVTDLFDDCDPKHDVLREKVNLFNQTSDVQWRLDWTGAIQPTEGAKSDEELKKLQASANTLAIFLSNE